jgi:hypothetical protein
MGVFIEIRYVDGCPNVQTVQERLAAALTATGLADAHVRLRLIRTDRQAAILQFTGSPTILIEGIDPFTETDAWVGLCCRPYRTPHGLARAPTIEQLIAALTIAVDSTLSRPRQPEPTVPKADRTIL